MRRALRFIQLIWIQRSVGRAFWVDAYENFKPGHGK